MKIIFRYKRIIQLAIFCLGLILLIFPTAVFADNCSGLRDCFNSARAALAASAGLGIFLVLLSTGLDFIPVVGDIKGVIEGIVGRNLFTGEKLAAWERGLGAIPLLGRFAKIGKVAKAVDRIADIAKIADRVDDIADAARAVDRIDDIADAARAVDRIDDIADAARAVDRIDDIGDAVKAVDRIDDIGDAAKAVDKVDDVGDAVKAVDKVDDASDAAKAADKIDDVEDFQGTLRGEKVTLPGVKTEKITMTKRPRTEYTQLRKKFDSSGRSDFLKKLGKENTDQLKTAGFTKKEIELVNKGKVPKGWQVHHKQPLDVGGSNSFDNLVLIKNEPYHKVITNEQRKLLGNLLPGQSSAVDFPMPSGLIYPP